ncbi:MAG TPA: alpha/beta fold hydrolase, partial [Pseudonocardia sp.]|nr:alpha/beta fold hydrolase [Pseudonocardia sp.]
MDEPELIMVDAGPVALGARSWPGGAARPVLLVHGMSSNARLWDGVAERLAAAGHPVVAVDLRGHGTSVDVSD